MEFFQKYGIYILGFVAQGLFGARLIVQLVISEKKGKVSSPTAFWYLSLAASFLFLVYGILRVDAVIIFGQTLSYYIYIRNLQLKGDWQKFSLSSKSVIFLLPPLALCYVLYFDSGSWNSIVQNFNVTDPIIFLGAVGQLMLNIRFVHQWYFSEKSHESILPLGFWVISTVASVLVIVYAVYRLDPVLLVAQGLGIIVYIRNMVIHFKHEAPRNLRQRV